MKQINSHLIQRLLTSKVDIDSELVNNPNALYPDKLRRCRYKNVWKCGDAPYNRLDRIIPKDVLHELETATNTTMERDFNLQVVLIGGYDEEACHRALHSLDVARDLFKVGYVSDI